MPQTNPGPCVPLSVLPGVPPSQPPCARFASLLHTSAPTTGPSTSKAGASPPAVLQPSLHPGDSIWPGASCSLHNRIHRPHGAAWRSCPSICPVPSGSITTSHGPASPGPGIPLCAGQVQREPWAPHPPHPGLPGTRAQGHCPGPAPDPSTEAGVLPVHTRLLLTGGGRGQASLSPVANWLLLLQADPPNPRGGASYTGSKKPCPSGPTSSRVDGEPDPGLRPQPPALSPPSPRMKGATGPLLFLSHRSNPTIPGPALGGLPSHSHP